MRASYVVGSLCAMLAVAACGDSDGDADTSNSGKKPPASETDASGDDGADAGDKPSETDEPGDDNSDAGTDGTDAATPDSTYGIVDEALCGGCPEGRSCFHLKGIDVAGVYLCHRPCETADDCPSEWFECAGPNARAYDVPTCGDQGYCEFKPKTITCEEDLGEPGMCKLGSCVATGV